MSLTPLDGRSDRELGETVSAVLAEPRRDPADSFVLHAPLELAARMALLAAVAPERRCEARSRIADVAEQYVAFGPDIGPPADASFDSTSAAAVRLAAALDAGDLEETDRCAAWLGRATGPWELRRLLADALIPRLAAAAHAPIYLWLAPRVWPRGGFDGGMLRATARELARNPNWRLSWQDNLEDDGPGDAGDRSATALFEAVAATPRLGVPGSEFIYPVMSQIEGAGVAELLSGPVAAADLAWGGRQLLRAAALSMLAENEQYAPYGWSHCFTMPQAVLGIAGASRRPRAALAVAATFVCGFRAAFSAVPLPAQYEPEPPPVTLEQALAEAPEHAAAALWVLPDDQLAAAVTTLATFASCHSDAHLAKYTLACLDAAAWDRPARRLYLAGAARLAGYWAGQGRSG